MVFQKPTIQRDRITTEFIKGQRAAKRGDKYFNPYSKVSQAQAYRQFEYGWKDQMKKNTIDEVKRLNKNTQEGKNYHITILALGIFLAYMMYLAFFQSAN